VQYSKFPAVVIFTFSFNRNHQVQAKNGGGEPWRDHGLDHILTRRKVEAVSLSPVKCLMADQLEILFVTKVCFVVSEEEKSSQVKPNKK
jgi:hypothetical protein